VERTIIFVSCLCREARNKYKEDKWNVGLDTLQGEIRLWKEF
jgi:hypothetical protein